ncbi:MAG: arginase family protein [Methanothrix sp.]|nr:arginase family protein [Methanothrix sp.]
MLFDSTTSFRSGSREGPDAIRRASHDFESYDYYYDVDLADLKICEWLYLSIDLDALDPACAPAVGDPEPFGLSPWDV